MKLLRITAVTPLDRFRLRLVLTDGSTVERDVEPLLVGPVFDPVRDDLSIFQSTRVEHGTVVWSNGADLCHDVLIWNGPPREGVAPAAVTCATGSVNPPDLNA